MIAQQVARLIIDIYLFLETTDEELLDPDTAVEMEEYIGHRLDQMDRPFLRQLVDAISVIAPEYGDYEQLVRDFPEAFGIPDVLEGENPGPSSPTEQA